MIVCLVGAAAFASAAVAAEIAGGKSCSDFADWTDTWRLDSELSESNEKMLKTLEVPWLVRKIAVVFVPTLVISAQDGVLEVSSKSPFGDRVNRIHGDQKMRDGEDRLGRPLHESSRWTAGGELIINRNIELKSGRIAKLQTRWVLSDATIIATTRAVIADEPAIEVRRVFERVIPSAS
jgi:hypothetical protein